MREQDSERCGGIVFAMEPEGSANDKQSVAGDGNVEVEGEPFYMLVKMIYILGKV